MSFDLRLELGERPGGILSRMSEMEVHPAVRLAVEWLGLIQDGRVADALALTHPDVRHAIVAEEITGTYGGGGDDSLLPLAEPREIGDETLAVVFIPPDTPAILDPSGGPALLAGDGGFVLPETWWIRVRRLPDGEWVVVGW